MLNKTEYKLSSINIYFPKQNRIANELCNHQTNR